MDAAAHEQVARQRARRRVIAHLIDAQLAAAGAGLEEVVVREVLDEVARGVHVGPVPRLAVRIGRQRALAAEQVVLLVGAVLASSRSTPVSIVLIVAATSSMCPYSSAAMFEIRS